MKEYIEREAVEEILENAQIISNGEYCGYCTEDVRLNSIPAADVAEVRHGRWEKFSTSNGIILRVRCSCCAGTQPLTFENMPYCPYCGARMDKEDEHGSEFD